MDECALLGAAVDVDGALFGAVDVALLGLD